MKKHIAIEPIGLVEGSSLDDIESVLKMRKIADMWNCHIPALLTPLVGSEQGNIGLAEVISLVSMETLKQELQERGWEFAPSNLFLCGKTADGKWVLPQLGEFTVLNAPKRFAGGRPDFYPWMHIVQRVLAFGLTPLSTIFTKVGEIKVGIRFPVIKIGS